MSAILKVFYSAKKTLKKSEDRQKEKGMVMLKNKQKITLYIKLWILCRWINILLLFEFNDKHFWFMFAAIGVSQYFLFHVAKILRFLYILKITYILKYYIYKNWMISGKKNKKNLKKARGCTRVVQGCANLHIKIRLLFLKHLHKTSLHP